MFFFFFSSCTHFCLFPSHALFFNTAVFFGFVFSSCCVLFDIIKDLLRHEVCTADSKQLRAAFYGVECLQMWFYSTWVQLTQPDKLSGRDIMVSKHERTKFSVIGPGLWNSINNQTSWETQRWSYVLLCDFFSVLCWGTLTWLHETTYLRDICWIQLLEWVRDHHPSPAGLFFSILFLGNFVQSYRKKAVFLWIWCTTMLLWHKQW